MGIRCWIPWLDPQARADRVCRRMDFENKAVQGFYQWQKGYVCESQTLQVHRNLVLP
jgi:hypothetical protein